jgi:beta-N-acetylhexosaminidase
MECPKIAADGPVVTRRAPDWTERDRALQDIAISRSRDRAIRRGAVFEDTHFEAGHLRVPLDEFERGNWIPFRSLVGGGAFTMLSHARLTSQAGIAAAGVAALNAGVDLILVSDDPAQYFTMMNALITADRAGGLAPVALARSARRLAGTAR